MKKTLFFLLFIITTNSFSQNYADTSSGKFDKMANLYNHEKYEEAKKISDELLSGKYGELSDYEKFYTLIGVANYYYKKDDYQKAYSYYQQFLDFDKTYSPKKIDNKKTYINEAKEKIKELEPKLSLASLSTNKTNNVTHTNNSSNTTTANKDIITENQNSETKKIETNNDRITTLSDTGTDKSLKDQINDKTVTLTVSGSGKTLEEAKTNALRSAIEQAFGAFISSKTEILNDQVIADQIASVANGNIQSYDMLNESQLSDGSWGVTLKALVSINKLTSFVQAKGIAIEIKGGLFAMNIKQQLLNEQGEIKVVAEMVGLLHEPMQTAFDYSIKSGEPKSLDSESKNWAIPLEVTAIANKNMDFCANYCIKTLAAISLSNMEAESYKLLNKEVFPVYVSYNGTKHTFYLRKLNSINCLNTLISQWEFYVSGFTVLNGIDESEGKGKNNLHHFNDSSYIDTYKNSGGYNYKTTSISFLTSENIAGTFAWEDTRTLAQIEQITSYTVKPSIIRSQFKHGGFVIYEKEGHGLVACIISLETFNWNEATQSCQDLAINGYDDWYLPSKDELNLVYLNLSRKKIGGFDVYNYYVNGDWFHLSSSPYANSNSNSNTYFCLDLYSGEKFEMLKRENYKYFARAIRKF